MMERAGVPAAMFSRPEILASEASETGSRDGHLVQAGTECFRLSLTEGL